MSDLEEKLSKGCIEAMKEGVYIEKPIVQILNNFPSVPSVTSALPPFRVIISDGSQSMTVIFAVDAKTSVVGSALNNSIVCLDCYQILPVSVNGKESKVILVTEIHVLIAGQKIGKIINGLEDVTRSLLELKNPRCDLKHTNMLTPYVLKKMMQGKKVLYPVVQILCIQKTTTDCLSRPHYRITISDGVEFCTKVILDVNLSELITNGKLSKYSVVRIKDYGTLGCHGITIPEMLVIRDLSVIVEGAAVDGIIRSSLKMSKRNTLNYCVGIASMIIIPVLFLLLRFRR